MNSKPDVQSSPPPPNAVTRLYPAAAHGQHQVEGRDLRWRPASLVHAKEAGTRAAACGTALPNWHTFWDLGLRDVPSSLMCPACRDAAAALDDRGRPRNARTVALPVLDPNGAELP